MFANVPVEYEPAGGGTFDVRRFLRVVLHKWWLLVCVAPIFAGLGFIYVRRIPVTYQAKAVLQVEQEQKNLLSVEEVSQQDLRAGEVVNTIVQNLKNSSVLLRVIRANHLTNDPVFLGLGSNFLSEAKLVNKLSGMVVAKLRPETRLIDITVTHADPDMARRLANSVAEEFIRHNLAQRFSTTKAANELLLAEAPRLKEQLEESERNIQEYKEQNQTVSLEESQNIVVEKLKALNQKFAAAKADRVLLEADWAQIQRLTNQPDAILNLASVMQDPAVVEVRKKIVQAQAEVATLAQRYKPKYPKMIQAQRQLDDLQGALRQMALGAPHWVQSAYEGALEREKSLQNALHEVQLESLELDKKSIQYNVLLRDVQSNRALYDSVLKRLKETDLTKGLEKTSISLVEPAARAGAPARISTRLVMIAAAGMGLLLSLGLIYLLDRIDTSVHTVDEAERLLGLPVLAAIPVAKSLGKGLALKLLEKEPGSVCAEAFRTLRTTTGLLLRECGKRVVAFTSADPGEGKTFFSVNHAVCQAQGGKRTLLIDLDLRRPSVGKGFSIPAEAPGVAEYLLGEQPLSSLVREVQSQPNLFILPAGGRISHPAETMGQDALRQLVAEAAVQFERVVIDTAPINAVSDAFLVLHLVDVICLVVRSGRTPRRGVLRAMELMARHNVPPTGVVLNFLPTRGGHEYFYHYAPKEGYYSNGAYKTPDVSEMATPTSAR